MVHHDALVCVDHGDDVPCDWVVLHQLRHLVAVVEGDGCAYHQGVVLLPRCVVVIHYNTLPYHTIPVPIDRVLIGYGGGGFSVK